MSVSFRFAFLFWVCISCCGCLLPGDGAHTLSISLAPKEAQCSQVPVHADITLPESLSQVPLDEIDVIVTAKDDESVVIPGQLVKAPEGKVSLWWIVPEAGKKAAEWTVNLQKGRKADKTGFSFREEKGKHIDLLFDGRKKMRYMCAFDPSTEESLHDTYKVYCHVFDAQGEKVLTKGPGGLYTHHRGLFIGWNRVTCDGKEYDFWHMKGVVQRHVEVLEQQAGPVLAKLKTRIHWDYLEGRPMIIEDREITVFRQELPSLLWLEFRSNLRSVQGGLILNGDPEHAGFQYRPHNDVAEGKDDERIRARYLFHTETTDPKKDKDLPWAACTYGLNDGQYTVQHLNAPENPMGTLYSAYRDYGRFGAFPAPTIAHGETLTLRYGIYVREGDEPTREEMAGRYSVFF